MKSIATIIHQKTFPLYILDEDGIMIYYEDPNGRHLIVDENNGEDNQPNNLTI